MASRYSEIGTVICWSLFNLVWSQLLFVCGLWATVYNVVVVPNFVIVAHVTDSGNAT